MVREMFLAAVLSLVSVCGTPCRAMDSVPIEGSGAVISETRKTSPFRSLKLDGAFVTTIVCGKEQRVVLTGDDNVIPQIKTEVGGDSLYVYSTRAYSTKDLLRLYVYVKELSAVSVSGAHTVTLNGVANASLTIDADGANGLTVTGNTKRLTINLAGGASVAADDLKADWVSIEILGAGNAEIHAASRLDVNITGTGTVTYSGNPKEVARQISGIGNLTQK